MRLAHLLRSLGLAVAPVLATTGPSTSATAAHAGGRGEHAGSARSASIEGRIEISRALGNHRPRFRIYAEPGPGALPPERDANDQDERQNVVLYVERAGAPSLSADGGGDPTAVVPRATLRQHGERFTPHVLPVVRGTAVDFVNDDALFHNVFSLSHAKEFDLGRYPRGIAKTAVFDRPGVVQVFCHIHSDMSAVVLVLDNPYFATPDAAGHYAIPNLPAGDYTVVAWHERIRPIPHRMHVEPGQAVRLDFTIPLPAADAAREH